MCASVPSPPWESHELLLVKMNDFFLRFKKGAFFALDSKVFAGASIVRIDLWDDVLDVFDRTHFVMCFCNSNGAPNVGHVDTLFLRTSFMRGNVCSLC